MKNLFLLFITAALFVSNNGFAQSGNITLPAASKNNPSFQSIARGMQDSELEQKLLKIINNLSAEKNWKMTYTDCKILSSSWSPSGLEACLFGKGPSGQCSYQVFNFEKGKDGNPMMKKSGQQYRTTCP